MVQKARKYVKKKPIFTAKSPEMWPKFLSNRDRLKLYILALDDKSPVIYIFLLVFHRFFLNKGKGKISEIEFKSKVGELSKTSQRKLLRYIRKLKELEDMEIQAGKVEKP